MLKVRGQERRVAEISPATVERLAKNGLLSGPTTYGKVGRAQIPGMPGESAPDYETAAKRNSELTAVQTSETGIESAPHWESEKKLNPPEPESTDYAAQNGQPDQREADSPTNQNEAAEEK
ncbi:hypothetical protein RQN30_09985 [Arcanobacterium hippocoleae]